MELDGSLPCSKKPFTGISPQPDEYSLHLQTLFLCFNVMYPPCTLSLPGVLLQRNKSKILFLYYSTNKSCAVAQAVSRRPLTAAARVHAQVNPMGFVADKVALGQVFLRVLLFSPVNIILPWSPLFRK
jgi:hypothetical protein